MIKGDTRRLGIVIAVIVVFIILVIWAVVSYFYSLAGSNDGRIRINNYSSYVDNLSVSERKAIEVALYNTVSENISDTHDIATIGDAIIRDGSYAQNFSKGIYETTFIVDIESIKQSYRIEDRFSNLSVEESSLYDYTSLALCLPKSELKYGEFTCQDRLSQEAGLSQSDPITRYLPVSTLEYDISLKTGTTNKATKLELTVKLYLSEADYKTGKDAALNLYKQAVADWFVSKDLDINNYSITYNY